MMQQMWRCPKCNNEKYSKKEEATIKICYACQVDMVKVNEVGDGH